MIDTGSSDIKISSAVLPPVRACTREPSSALLGVKATRTLARNTHERWVHPRNIVNDLIQDRALGKDGRLEQKYTIVGGLAAILRG